MVVQPDKGFSRIETLGTKKPLRLQKGSGIAIDLRPLSMAEPDVIHSGGNSTEISLTARGLP